MALKDPLEANQSLLHPTSPQHEICSQQGDIAVFNFHPVKIVSIRGSALSREPIDRIWLKITLLRNTPTGLKTTIG